MLERTADRAANVRAPRAPRKRSLEVLRSVPQATREVGKAASVNQSPCVQQPTSGHADGHRRARGVPPGMLA
ncbi:hypothetical protein [Rarobacter incanus]|uniref:hypothetical protein n=1 Tax=Rarobacter incanus TaxID=153494 RepID=UPI00114FD98A|nr:hypothetical protein [Rarobacter incanus]